MTGARDACFAIPMLHRDLDVIAAPGQLLCECQESRVGFGFFFSSILFIENNSSGCGTVGNSERFWRRVFHSPTTQRGPWAKEIYLSFLNQQERLTAIRGPTQWSAHSRGCGPLDLDSRRLDWVINRKPGFSVSNTNLPVTYRDWSFC
jgi:hypothetical protein